MNRRFRIQEKADRTTTHKLISFQVGNERYAIAINHVQRILQEFTAQVTRSGGQSLVKYNHETITLIDLFQLFHARQNPQEPNYLIICTISPGEYLGIPVAEMPSVLEVSQEQFGEIPALYRQGKISEAVEKLVNTADGSVIFYLNLEQMINQI